MDQNDINHIHKVKIKASELLKDSSIRKIATIFVVKEVINFIMFRCISTKRTLF